MGVPSSTPTHIIACEVVTSGQQRAKKDGPAYSIALVPLTSQMFPSAAAPAFRQLFEAYASNGGKMTMEAYYERVVGRVSARVEAGEHFAVPVAVCLAEGSSSEWRVVGLFGDYRTHDDAVLRPTMYNTPMNHYISLTVIRLACIMLKLTPSAVLPKAVELSCPLKKACGQRIVERLAAFAGVAAAHTLDVSYEDALDVVAPCCGGCAEGGTMTVAANGDTTNTVVTTDWFVSTMASYARGGVSTERVLPNGLKSLLLPDVDLPSSCRFHTVWNFADHNNDNITQNFGSMPVRPIGELTSIARSRLLERVVVGLLPRRASSSSAASSRSSVHSMSTNSPLGGSPTKGPRFSPTANSANRRSQKGNPTPTPKYQGNPGHQVPAAGLPPSTLNQYCSCGAPNCHLASYQGAPVPTSSYDPKSPYGLEYEAYVAVSQQLYYASWSQQDYC